MNRIEEARKQLGISRKELASRIGVDRTMIWRYEKNKNTPSDEIKVKISKELKKTVEEIFFSQVVALDTTKAATGTDGV